MGIKFDVRMAVITYTKVGDDYQKIEVTKKFGCNNYDDLENLFLILVASSEDTLHLSIDKKEVDD